MIFYFLSLHSLSVDLKDSQYIFTQLSFKHSIWSECSATKRLMMEIHCNVSLMLLYVVYSVGVHASQFIGTHKSPELQVVSAVAYLPQDAVNI